MISDRTKAALAAKKQRGEVLGNPTNIAQAGQAGRRVQPAEADRFAANLLPIIIRSIQSAGPIGMVSIAKLLKRARKPDSPRRTVACIVRRKLACSREQLRGGLIL